MKIKNLIIVAMSVILLVGCSNRSEKQASVSGEPNHAGAYQEMNTPEFWISGLKNPDKLSMSASQIKEFNETIPKTDGTNCVNLNKYKKILSGEELLIKIRQYTVPDEERYIDEILLDKTYYEQLLLNRNEASVKEQNPVKFGVIIQNTEVRNFPTSDVSYWEANAIEFDLGCESVLKTGERVVVLHESTDQKWQYVQAYNYIGWVKTEDTAFCTNDDWELLAENSDWLTVTGNRITLDVNNVNSKVSGKELTMGTKLMLLKDKPATIDGISTESSYVVLFPIREESGKLKFVETRIPQGLDVTEGFLNYTPRNLIQQSFKILGERYGWGGLWNARDCASYIIDVYQCFGLELPRNADNQAAVPGKRVDVSNYSDEEKQALILKQPVGTMLEMNGHIMIYLGEYDGKPYVIQQGYSYIPSKDTKVVEAACVLVSNLEIKRSTGNVFLSEIRTVNTIQLQ